MVARDDYRARALLALCGPRAAALLARHPERFDRDAGRHNELARVLFDELESDEAALALEFDAGWPCGALGFALRRARASDEARARAIGDPLLEAWLALDALQLRARCESLGLALLGGALAPLSIGDAQLRFAALGARRAARVLAMRDGSARTELASETRNAVERWTAAHASDLELDVLLRRLGRAALASLSPRAEASCSPGARSDLASVLAASPRLESAHAAELRGLAERAVRAEFRA